MEEAQIREAHAIARAAFLAIGATSYGRVDLRIGRDGRFYVIDVNPNPDISSEAGLSIAAKSIGIEHDQLIQSFVEAACN
jgi:D-alanine-D-alanine ligase